MKFHIRKSRFSVKSRFKESKQADWGTFSIQKEYIVQRSADTSYIEHTVHILICIEKAEKHTHSYRERALCSAINSLVGTLLACYYKLTPQSNLVCPQMMMMKMKMCVHLKTWEKKKRRLKSASSIHSLKWNLPGFIILNFSYSYSIKNTHTSYIIYQEKVCASIYTVTPLYRITGERSKIHYKRCSIYPGRSCNEMELIPA